MTTKLLVAVDLSRLSEKLVAYARDLARRLGAEVTFIHVLPHTYLWKGYEPWIPQELDEEVRQIARKKIAYYLRKAEATDPPLEGEVPAHIAVEEGNPADFVVRKAREEGFDLIVVAYRGHSTLERLVVGSTASNIARYAHCSVLIYRPKGE